MSIMNKEDWNKITYEDVIVAIEKFNTEHPSYNKSRTTYLIYDGFDYPAKAIRKIAYKVHFGTDISVDEFSGGDESVRFFLRLGFHAVNENTGLGMDIKKISSRKMGKKSTKDESIVHKNKVISKKGIVMKKNDGEILKVGMVLEWDCCTEARFQRILDTAKSSDIDLLVFPEYCTHYLHVEHENCLCDHELNNVYEKCLAVSKEIVKPIVFGFEDSKGRLYSVYVNADAKKGETRTHRYVKHVMTSYSAFEEEDYMQFSQTQFTPIVLKNFKIGLTICYECEFPVFSRMYGLQGVDLVINCTGESVIAHKWGLFNKARAIENKCSVLVTMKYSVDYGSGRKSRTFGYNSLGGELLPYNINGSDNEWVKDGIYVYEVGKACNDTEYTTDNINAEKAENKNHQVDIPVNNVQKLILKSTEIDEGIYCHSVKNRNENLIICLVDGMDILVPEKFLPMLYNPKLRTIKHKRYVLVNRHKHLTEKTLEETLSPILKVRAMENFCVVILESDNFSKCYQTSFNKMSQSVMASGDVFKIDISRATGPEATWKNKNNDNMLKKWRSNYEMLIEKIAK